MRNLATVIDLHNPVPSSRLGKRALKRQRRYGIEVEEVDDVTLFWDIIVEDRRVRHNTVPVHNAGELALLHSRFPSEIRFLRPVVREQLLPELLYTYAVECFICNMRHVRRKRKDIYATDVIYHDVIFNRFPGAAYFDFGTSNEDAYRFLNAGMVAHKEEFGGRSVIYDTYRVEVTSIQQ